MPFEREAEVLPLHCIFAVKPGSPDHVGTKCAGLFPPALEAEEAPALQPWASTGPRLHLWASLWLQTGEPNSFLCPQASLFLPRQHTT